MIGEEQLYALVDAVNKHKSQLAGQRKERFAKDLADYEAFKVQRQADGKWHDDEFIVDKSKQCILLNRAYPDKQGVYEIPAFVNGKSCFSLQHRNFVFWDSHKHLTVINRHNRIEDMSNLFFGNSNLESIDLSQFDTSNVLSFEGMFANCINLQKVDLSNFDTENANSLSYMFFNCKRLETIKVSIIGSHKNLLGMFFDCRDLQSIDFSNSFVEELEGKGIFNGCQNLKSVLYKGGLTDWQSECRPYLARGFVSAFDNGEPYSNEAVKEYNAYIKRHSENFFGFSDKNREIFTYMLENKLITPKKLSMMLDRSDATTEERAALLEYQRKNSKRRSDNEYLLD